MKFIVKNDNVAITGVIDGKPPARGDVLDIAGAKYETLVTTQLYESGGSVPQPYMTTYVRPTKQELAKRAEQRRAEMDEQAIQDVRRELGLAESPPVTDARAPSPPAELSEITKATRRLLASGDDRPSPAADTLHGATSAAAGFMGAMTAEAVRRELLLDDVSGGSTGHENSEKTKQELAL